MTKEGKICTEGYAQDAKTKSNHKIREQVIKPQLLFL